MSKHKRRTPQKSNSHITEIKNNVRDLQKEANDEIKRLGLSVLSLASTYSAEMANNQELKSSISTLNNDYQQYSENINTKILNISEITKNITSKKSEEILPKILNESTELMGIVSEAKSVITKDVELIHETAKKYNLDKLNNQE